MYFKRSGFQHAKSVYLETLDEEDHKPEMVRKKWGRCAGFSFSIQVLCKAIIHSICKTTKDTLVRIIYRKTPVIVSFQ